MRLVFFGTSDFAISPLNALMKSGHEILAVVTQPDRRSGRGRHIASSPVKIEARGAGLRIFQPQKVGESGFIRELETLAPQVIIVVAYGQILPPEILNLPEFGCINVHASLLPKYRGAAPINWALINGEKKTGITIMLMDEGMDTGPILLQEETDIMAEDTAGSLSFRLSEIGASLLIKTLQMLEKGSLRPRPQLGSVSYAPILKKADGLINWSRSAKRLCNFIRGMNPWPGAYSFLEGERVKVLKAVSVDGEGDIGVIKKVTKDELLVGTGDGVLSILELQPPGRPTMTVKAYLQGRRLREGLKFYEKPVS